MSNKWSHIDYKTVDWSDGKKQQYRQHCIIDNYRKLFRVDAVENDYWTLCGSSTIDGRRNEGCEFEQLVKSGLVKPEQFYGVDNDATIIALNKTAYPNAIWICDDFVNAIHHNKFTPSIIHADMINMPAMASEIARGIIGRVEDCNTRTMVVFNVVIKRPIDKVRVDLLEFLHLSLRHATHAWHVLNEIYIYRGAVSSQSRTHLATYTMIHYG